MSRHAYGFEGRAGRWRGGIGRAYGCRGGRYVAGRQIWNRLGVSRVRDRSGESWGGWLGLGGRQLSRSGGSSQGAYWGGGYTLGGPDQRGARRAGGEEESRGRSQRTRHSGGRGHLLARARHHASRILRRSLVCRSRGRGYHTYLRRRGSCYRVYSGPGTPQSVSVICVWGGVEAGVT